MSTPRIGQVGPSHVAAWGKGDDETAEKFCELAISQLNEGQSKANHWTCNAAADRGWFVAVFAMGDRGRKLNDLSVDYAVNELRLAWVKLIDPGAIDEYERRTLRTADQAIEVDVHAPKGILTVLGPVEAVTYNGTLQGDHALYEHTFKGDAQPLLVVDEANRLHLIGGDYHVADVGIVDGPADGSLGDEYQEQQPSQKIAREPNPAIHEVALFDSDLAIIAEALRSAEHQEQEEARRHRFRRVKGKVLGELRQNPVNIGSGPLAMALPGPDWSRLAMRGSGPLAMAQPGPDWINRPTMQNGPPLLGPCTKRSLPRQPFSANPWTPRQHESGFEWAEWETDSPQKAQEKAEKAKATAKEAIKRHKPPSSVSVTKKTKREIADLQELGRRVSVFADRDRARLALGKVHEAKEIEKGLPMPRYAVATDGHRLAVLPVAKEITSELIQSSKNLEDPIYAREDFPDVKAVFSDPATSGAFSSDALRKVIKAGEAQARSMKAKDPQGDYTARVVAIVDDTLDLTMVPTVVGSEIWEDRSFAIVGSGGSGPAARILLSADYLKDAIADHHGAIDLGVSDSMSPVRLDRDDGEIHIIMPMQE